MRPFSGLAEYKEALLAKPQVFAHAFVNKLAVYSTGRAMGFSDREELDHITQTVANLGYSFRDLIRKVIQSELLRNQ